jgi:hypothetical protein
MRECKKSARVSSAEVARQEREYKSEEESWKYKSSKHERECTNQRSKVRTETLTVNEVRVIKTVLGFGFFDDIDTISNGT